VRRTTSSTPTYSLLTWRAEAVTIFVSSRNGFGFGGSTTATRSGSAGWVAGLAMGSTCRGAGAGFVVASGGGFGWPSSSPGMLQSSWIGGVTGTSFFFQGQSISIFGTCWSIQAHPPIPAASRTVAMACRIRMVSPSAQVRRAGAVRATHACGRPTPRLSIIPIHTRLAPRQVD